MRAWQRWQEAQNTLQKKREAEAKLLWANKPDKLQQAKEEITEVRSTGNTQQLWHHTGPSVVILFSTQLTLTPTGPGVPHYDVTWRGVWDPFTNTKLTSAFSINREDVCLHSKIKRWTSWKKRKFQMQVSIWNQTLVKRQMKKPPWSNYLSPSHLQQQ